MAITKSSKTKVITAIIAVVMAVTIIFGGAFAWTSISQTALNEVAMLWTLGGRLHDDFVDITFGIDEIADYETMTFDKNVYVENFTSLAGNGVQVFARVRLDEYMELGKGVGGLNADGNVQTTNFDVNYALTNGSDNLSPVTVEDTIINNTAAKVAVYSQALNADCVLNGMTVDSTNGIGIASELHSGYDLILNDCIVNQTGVTNEAKPWTEAAVVAWGNGSIVINSGTYTSTGWAVYVYNTDAGTITINGGTFSVDSSEYVDLDAYDVIEDNGMYTVVAK